VTAVTVGLFALSSVGSGLVHGPADPLANAVEPSAEPLATATGSADATTSTASTGPQQSLTSPGGTVVASCVNGGVYLALWSPAQGFHTDDVLRGPSPSALVTFESPTLEVAMTITCVDGVPRSTYSEGPNH
jgi:serine/threonine-protein kinase